MVSVVFLLDVPKQKLPLFDERKISPPDPEVFSALPEPRSAVKQDSELDLPLKPLSQPPGLVRYRRYSAYYFIQHGFVLFSSR